MVKIKLVKKVELSGFGDDWKDCYVEIVAPTYKDIKSITAINTDDQEKSISQGIDILKRLFVSGKVNTDKGVSSITKEDIEELPLQILIKCFKEMSGQIDPK